MRKNKLFMLIFILMIGIRLVLADQTIVRTYVNMTSNGINFNMTGEGTDNKWGTPLNCTTTIINGTSNTTAFCNITSFSKEYELLLIRSLSCNQTDIYNLTKTCNEAILNATNYQGCIQSKEIVVKNLADADNESIYYKNYSDFWVQEYYKKKSDYDQMKTNFESQQKIASQKDTELQTARSQQWFYGLGGVVATLLGFYFFYIKPKKPKGLPQEQMGQIRNADTFQSPFQK